MIETVDDCNNFFNENERGDLILHIISRNHLQHPCETKPLILFIYNISTEKSYYLSINHIDSIVEQDVINDFLTRFSKTNNKKWVYDSKSFNQLLYCGETNDINLITYLESNKTIDINDFETPAHNIIKQHASNSEFYNKSVPLLKHKELFLIFCKHVAPIIKGYKETDGYSNINKIVIPALREIEYNGLYVDADLFVKYFEQAPNKDRYVRCQYNIYTSTGRPSNSFSGINYSALNTSDGSRSCFVSRFGEEGQLVEIDYSTFHPRIACLLANYKIDVNVNVYAYLAKLYFNKQDITPEEFDDAKKITFKQFYGGIEDKYLHIKYLSKLNSYIFNQWERFKENNYIYTPMFNRKITDNHIKDPNPYKLFNYILQATEYELVNSVLMHIHTELFNYKTKPILTTYDSMLFDVYTPELNSVLTTLKPIINLDGKFPIKIKSGKNYNEMNVL